MDVHYEFAARYVGRTGRVAVTLELADAGPGERMHRLLIEPRTEPELVRRFADGLRRVAEGSDAGPARLAEVAE